MRSGLVPAARRHEPGGDTSEEADMTDVDAALRALKEQALRATKRHDAEFYRDYLADDAIAVTPAGVFDKTAILAAMGRPDTPFQSSTIEGTEVVGLSGDAGIVTYRATFAVDSGAPRTVFVTTVYRKQADGWKGVLYQQTPMIGTTSGRL
jgi:ketosteroid isomerase-like protein